MGGDFNCNGGKGNQPLQVIGMGSPVHGEQLIQGFRD